MDETADDRHNKSVCKLAVYAGRVQGVGFRYAAQELSRDFPVNGYVRNLPEGTVEVLAEGPAEEVSNFFAAIDRRMAEYIKDKSIQDAPSSDIRGFRIRY
jgi:acylphosphatase